jgi:uronate dehydrogenase
MNPSSRQRILLTGAAGRISGGIVSDLQKDYDLVLTDAIVPEDRQDDMSQLDLLDFPAVRDAMKGVDQVIHLAIASGRALKHLPIHEYNDEQMRVNLIGTQHVYAAAVQTGVKRVVYFSSMTVWMGIPEYDHVSLDTPLRPRGVYGCTKLFGEHMAEHYTRGNDISIICLRLGHPIPTPGCEYNSEYLRQYGDNGVMCDFEDIKQGVRCALNAQDLKYYIFPLVSASQENRVELTAGIKVGYWPKKCFNSDGEVIDNPTPMPENIG